MDNRKPRSLETRETSARMDYQPPSALPTPEPQEGWGFRWVAISVLGQADPANASKRMRDGWEPVKATEHPELAIAASTSGNIEMGGLILCKAPIERLEARDRYYRQQATDQLKAVNNAFLQNNDSRMPLFNEHRSEDTKGTFGSGNK